MSRRPVYQSKINSEFEVDKHLWVVSLIKAKVINQTGDSGFYAKIIVERLQDDQKLSNSAHLVSEYYFMDRVALSTQKWIDESYRNNLESKHCILIKENSPNLLEYKEDAPSDLVSESNHRIPDGVKKMINSINDEKETKTEGKDVHAFKFDGASWIMKPYKGQLDYDKWATEKLKLTNESPLVTATISSSYRTCLIL